MNEIDNGGPAFPGQYAHGGGQIESWVGMTLRDYFAAKAMQVLKDDVWNFELLCKNAYEIADQMLKSREAK